ncbi:MAG TPA: glycoside hydrolase family 13 protein [Jatrophihabitans sp.]|jgi:alpha-glucosidase|uniref:glycoside hydrolase family 13 protein n=1 Tax=Jatrophihabitans sp. TaxID=1932789 RepID=UPI002E02E8BA|nr:glycoside hydrolase family 13 protein [Jatrophihabitans sp.]
MTGAAAPSERPWWRDAVMYQVYLRSFADGNGDGVGDLPGLRARLPYLRDLGVDGIWITPWYPSPMKDGGYDVADYCDIAPLFGTLADAKAVLGEARELGLRVIVDFVANHTSDEHPWFRAALAAAPGSPERDRYHFRDGTGPDGSEPPNDWISAFGGRAWSRITEPGGEPGQWYLHLFAPAQPDLNWDSAAVRADFATILRFWFDLGLDGLRLDAASGLAKEGGLPDHGFLAEDLFQPVNWVGSPLWDVEGVHDILREWRAIADGYPGDRMFVGEVVVNGPERLARYMRPDELHTTFNLDFLKSPLDADDLRRTISATLSAFDQVGAPATWTLSNHDETRHVTRYGREYTGVPLPPPWPSPPSDRELGARRARAMLLVMLALPGSVYLYQGEELGLWEVEDLPDSVIQDPVWESSGHTIRGRDGCRVPLPWAATGPSLGFSPGAVEPWLPQPAEWSAHSVESEDARPGSMLEFYRSALRVRRASLAPGDPLDWVDLGGGVLAFDRGPVRCVFNRSTDVVQADGTVLLASDASEELLAPDTAAWLLR